jgi:hypothetical protein
MSTEEAFERLLNPTPIPDEPERFEDLVQKTRDLLEPTFGPLMSETRQEGGLAGVTVLSFTTGGPPPVLTEKQKEFIKFLFDGRADRLLNKRDEEMKEVEEQIRRKTNGTMKLPESEEPLVQLFFISSKQNLDYMNKLRMIIVAKGCAPPSSSASKVRVVGVGI